jgi:hypothetical protein
MSEVNNSTEYIARVLEDKFYGSALDKVQGARADQWLNALAARLPTGASPLSSLYSDMLAQRRDAFRNILRDIAELAGLDLNNVAFDFVKLETPVATTWGPQEDGSIAIVADINMVGVLNGLLIAGLEAMRRDDPSIFVDVVDDYVATLYLSRVTPLFELRMLTLLDQTQDLQQLYTLAGRTMFSFVLAHEVGHIACGHLNGPDALTVRPTASVQPVPVSCFSRHEQEYEADAWAADTVHKLAVATNQVMPVLLSQTVPAIYLAFDGLMGRVHRPVNPAGRLISETHPDPWDRLDRLKALQKVDDQLIRSTGVFEPLVDLPTYVKAQADKIHRD